MRSPDATSPQGDCDAFVDFHTMFGRYRDETLFGDHIHLLPEGDRLVGETYACAVWEALEAAGRLAARPALRRDP
jgi:hypothetical protein